MLIDKYSKLSGRNWLNLWTVNHNVSLWGSGDCEWPHRTDKSRTLKKIICIYIIIILELYCIHNLKVLYLIVSIFSPPQVHLSNKVLMCRICEKGFATQHDLASHMKANHFPSEMPYVCHLCNFRSSMYSDVVDHFKKVA